MQALAPHLAPDGYVLSAQNGLNEIVIAASSASERTMGCFVNFGADWLEPGGILVGNRGAVVVGEIDGEHPRPRTREMHALLQSSSPTRSLTDEHLGLSLGQAGLWRDAVRHRADQRVDRRCAGRARATAALAPLGREVMAVAAAQGVRCRRLQRLRSRGLPPPAPDRGDAERCHGRAGRLQPRSAKTPFAASGATWPCASAGPRSTPRSRSIAEIGRSLGLRCPLIRAPGALIHDSRGWAPAAVTRHARRAAAAGRVEADEYRIWRQDRHRHGRRARLWPRHQPWPSPIAARASGPAT